MHRVEILTFPDGQLLDVAGPLQAFASCNGLLGEQGRPPAYTITALAAGGGQVTMSSGLGLALAPLPPAGSPCDTLIVAGGRGVDAAIADTDLLLWLTARCRATPRVASVCTGAFLLAATGILDGRRAATHWAWCARLADRHPRVRVDPDPIFLVDGNVWTSAGDGVHCYAPDGTLLGRIKIPEAVSNVCFGGPKRNRLFITATTSLYAVYLAQSGALRP